MSILSCVNKFLIILSDSIYCLFLYLELSNLSISITDNSIFSSESFIADAGERILLFWKYFNSAGYGTDVAVGEDNPLFSK